MCILLYVKLIQCSGILWIYGKLEEGALIDVHSAICHTDLVYWYSRDLWSLAGGVGQNLVGVVVFHRSMITCGEVI